jgi:hypothetical protein
MRGGTGFGSSLFFHDSSSMSFLAADFRSKEMASKSKHTGLGIALGAALGAVLGVMAGHIAIWLGLGIVIGMALGGTIRRAETECPECAALHRAHEDRSREGRSSEDRSSEDRAHAVNAKQLQS